MALESKFQSDLIKELREMLPGCEVRKQDTSVQQGLPDLLIFFHTWWGMLEVKRGPNEPRQANQEWFVDYYNRMSFAAVIFPENKEEILHELLLQLPPRLRRKARFPQRK